MSAVRVLRKAVRWSFAVTLPGEAVLVVCLLSGARVTPVVRVVVESLVCAVVVAAMTLFALDYRRHHRDRPDRRAALRAAVADTVPALARRLLSHELALFTSVLRRFSGRGPHGVGEGDAAVPYAAAQRDVMYGLGFVSVVEAVALAWLVPDPVVHAVTLVVDVWAVYFVFALQLSCVVRPHVVGADGSLRLRYGVLVDVRIPARYVASVRVDRRFSGGRMGAVDADGVTRLGVGGQTTVTVELTRPVGFVRPLGRPAEARVFHWYAEDPAAAVAAWRARAVLDDR
ncbi:hypothetical protein [Streptantibioticus cattleyicolor]|uniref:Uncharacterized protein n=1 Tax=Streptantibioticus cattleyicolor (strain ATCC 35852 / DSM 46488 / JCM 4925 / NBRC 14057 / NRRL 8057) TaxID=1003195 RepID=F8JLT6_STREN|nr:hypothetical protein [Streptantibioticus cattleyicolor]AEW99478.1 hypothetical protein SCATT_p12850 [Streptantibioticus cattleyicolor NRRL 8057 = DSM 46488]CCB71480.1 conserved membrane protein of unknown function [Streptantibioticus cattleyicolor NRRL 8057 = DSM 46488]